jgi:hypothetical protein
MGTTYLRNRAGVMDSTKIAGCKVENSKGENLGKIESLMIDLGEGRILYTVLSFGGFLGMGDKLFPVPIEALSFRVNEKGGLERCILDVDKDTLKKAPGFERDQLPRDVDRTFASGVYLHYGYTPWWTE